MNNDSLIRGGRVLAWAAVLLLCSDFAAAAKDDDNERGDQHADTVKRYGRAKGRGNLAKYRKRKVRRVSGRQVTLGALAAKAFKEQKILARDLKRANKGLWGKVRVTTSVTETADAYIITQRTGAIVKDPKIVDKHVKGFRSSHVRRKQKTYQQLSKQQRKSFDNLVKSRFAKMPKAHPLRQAYAKGGKKGLLKAMMQGKGYYGNVETVVVPKAPPKLDAKGLEVRDFKRPGKKRRRKVKLWAKKSKKRSLSQDDAITVEPVGQPNDDDPFGLFAHLSDDDELAWSGLPIPMSIERTGERKRNFSFIAGRTIGHEWSRTWKETCSLGWVQIRLDASAAVGIRFPMTGSATLTPKTIKRTANADSPNEFTTNVTFRTVDGDTNFYANQGMPSDKRFGGKEFVLEASATVTLQADALGVGVGPWSVGPEFNEGDHFRPPQGGQSARLADFWVPSSVTSTDWSLWGYGVSASVGAKIDGHGDPSVEFEALAAGQVRKSWKSSETNNKRNKHRITITSADGQRLMKADTTGNCTANCDRTYGFRISDPRYTLYNLTVTPGLKLSGRLGWPFDESLNRTIWIDAGAFTLSGADLTFDKHPYTTSVVRHEDGTKKFRKN